MSRRVVVVDDNPANLALLEYLFKAAGYTTVVAADGAAGVAAAQAQPEPPDLILMDLQMPVMDGYEALRHLRADPRLRATPVVAITAFAMVGDRDKILAHGFDGYMPKPIAPATFAADIERFLPDRGPERDAAS